VIVEFGVVIEPSVHSNGEGESPEDYYDRRELETADDERAFDLTCTRLLNALAKTVTQAAQVLPIDESGRTRPWNRDEAVLAGMVVRCSKLLRAYAQNFEQRRLEVCNYLGRGLVETTVDLRYLLQMGTPETFQRFVAYSFVSDLKRRAEIQNNIDARSGVVLPIEERMLAGIQRRLDQAGITSDEVPSSPRDSWAGSVRDRLRKLGMEQMYQGAFAGPSAYTHGSWHELAVYHLDEADDRTGYYPDVAFSDVRPQPAGMLAIVMTEAVTEWLFKCLPETEARDALLSRLMAMHDASAEIEQLHENFLGRTGGPDLR
jgi:hypothetical protein